MLSTTEPPLQPFSRRVIVEDIKDPEGWLEWSQQDEGTGQEPPLSPLLFQLINSLLFLIDLIPEAGQLPVMGLTVILHL